MRPSKDEYFMAIAQVVALRSTCLRRAVGCVLVNSQSHIVATGYNGIVAGQAHCADNPCPAAKSPSGTDLDRCFAIHAEVNAVSQCDNVNDISIAYITTAPCVSCLKTLLTTSCKEIVFLYSYNKPALELWETYGRKWRELPTFLVGNLERSVIMSRSECLANVSLSTIS